MNKSWISITVFFLITSLACWFLKPMLQKNNIDTTVIFGANLILYLVSLVANYLNINAIANKKNNAFLGNVFGGFVIKFFVLLMAAFIYFYVAKKIETTSVLISMGLYIFYSLLVISNVLKQTKKLADAQRKSSV